MKNIEILVDATGSCDLDSIEKQLLKMQNELKNTSNNAIVNFYSFGEQINQNLQSLELPFSEENKNKMFLGGDDFNFLIKQKLKNNPDVLVFIGDCIEESIHSHTVEMVDTTQVIVIQSKYNAFTNTLEPEVLKNFVSEVAHFSFIKSTNVQQYTSLEDLLTTQPTIQGNIKNIRMNIYQDRPFDKLKP